MFLFLIHAEPRKPTANGGGGYISCWINFPIQDGAELLARHYIQQADWIPGEVEDVRWVERDEYLDHPSLQYYDEADSDGASFVFHLYPLDDVDEGSE